jgi:hypothetical protein
VTVYMNRSEADGRAAIYQAGFAPEYSHNSPEPSKTLPRLTGQSEG